MTASRKRRRTARPTPTPRSLASEDLLLFFTIFVALTGAIGLLNYPNSIRIVLLLGAALIGLLLVQLSKQRSVLDVAQRVSPRTRLLLALALITLLALSMIIRPVQERLRNDQTKLPAATSPSPAYVRYRVTSAVTLRAGPGLEYPAAGEVGSGTPVDVMCQKRAVGGEDKIWNHLTGGQWVLDEVTDSPNRKRNALSPPGRWC